MSMFFFPSDDDVYELSTDFKLKNKGNDLQLSEEDLLLLLNNLLEDRKNVEDFMIDRHNKRDR